MSPVPRNLKVVDHAVCVDWLTITCSGASQRKELARRFDLVRAATEQFGERVEPWHWRGYSGLHIGGFRWGCRDTDDILILSGPDAASFWSIFARGATNCSRLDLAVTVQTRRCYPRLLRTYSEWVAGNGETSQRKYTRVEDVEGNGKTLYVGSRASDQFGRLYDKGAEMGDPLMMHRLWRYEVELKSERAKQCVSQLLRAASSEEVNGLIQATVWRWFDERAIPPLFDKSGRGARLELTSTVLSSSQSLHWLSTQVRPTVERLLEAGLDVEVLAALGLD